ncbi:unnamed protein product [Rotaria sordida]|uniref:F-box domain-containing protein n=1 Tax=Rotaria sordida TaxID=392033 RepID=A0A819Y7E1_9BILA|nr:unnamed protein product [Rotaria sordida]CAF4155021.1 unnamed protein product [Rotaria sordida]
MESLPNEIVLIVFSYLKTYDIVYAFYFLKRRYARLIEEFRSFSTSINLINASLPIFNLYYSLIFQSYHINKFNIEKVKIECKMLNKFILNEKIFPRLESLSIIIRKTNELTILLKYFSFFTQLKQLYIRSDVCCCDRILFEEQVKQNFFQTNKIKLQSLTFATPPCFSISLQDINFEQCLFTNLTLTVRSMNDFCSILSSARQLRSLCIRVLDTNINHQNPLTITKSCPHLKYFLFICLNSVSYEIIKNIFKTLISIEKLSFSLVFDYQSGIIDGNRLYNDIFIYLSNLINLQFEIKFSLSIISNNLIQSFETPFWLDFSPIGFHSYNHIYTLPFPFHHVDLDQTILKSQQTRKSKYNWRFVYDINLYDRIPYTNEFLIYLRNEFINLTTLTLKWKFDLMISIPSLSTWFNLPTIRRLIIKLTSLQNPDIIKEFLLCLPNCDTLDCDYILIARVTSYFRPRHVLNEFGKRLRLLIVDELPSDWKIETKKRHNIYFHRFRQFFPNIECPLYY